MTKLTIRCHAFLYIAYVKRFSFTRPGSSIQVLAGASLDEKQIKYWLKEGKKADHDIWYEELPIFRNDGAGLLKWSKKPRELLVYFTDMGFEHTDDDFQWTDPVGRKAIDPGVYHGIARPVPVVSQDPGTLGNQLSDSDGYVGNHLYLWRVPCPWQSKYLLTPFTESSTENIDYGRPWSL